MLKMERRKAIELSRQVLAFEPDNPLINRLLDGFAAAPSRMEMAPPSGFASPIVDSPG
jgi:hypothetical protein